MATASRERTCRLSTDDESGAVILSISEVKGIRNPRKETSFYRVESNVNAPQCYRLHKLAHEGEEPRLYDVNIPEMSCDCPGEETLRARNATNEDGTPKHCRHLSSLSILIERGSIVMKKNEIKVGGLYLAKISGNIVTVRVDAIRERFDHKDRSQTVYDVSNLRTNRKTTFRSAAKFRSQVDSSLPHYAGRRDAQTDGADSMIEEWRQEQRAELED